MDLAIKIMCEYYQFINMFNIFCSFLRTLNIVPNLYNFTSPFSSMNYLSQVMKPSNFKKQSQSCVGSCITGLAKVINSRFAVKHMLRSCEQYTIHQGIDLNECKFVTIYLKQNNQPFAVRKIKQQLLEKISPSLLWNGHEKIDTEVYNVQVHERKGPSLHTLLGRINRSISHHDILLLMYQLKIKLVEKYSVAGYVHRELSPHNIILDAKPQRTQVYLLNTHCLAKQGEQTHTKASKFCSRASHLGLRTSTKDDLESICYILFFVGSSGKFLKNVLVEDYLQAKTQINWGQLEAQLPSILIQFYTYVVSLNQKDEINFYHWKNKLLQIIGKAALQHPYQWMLSKQSQIDKITTNQIIEEEKQTVQAVSLAVVVQPQQELQDEETRQQMKQDIIQWNGDEGIIGGKVESHIILQRKRPPYR